MATTTSSNVTTSERVWRAVAKARSPCSATSRRRAIRAAVIEIEGLFLTYGLGVPLRRMLDPALAQARAPETT